MIRQHRLQDEMNQRRLTSITTETVEKWAIRFGGRTGGDQLCTLCGSSTRWLSLALAGQLSGLTHVDVCRLADLGRVHSQLTMEGHLLICGISLYGTIQKGELYDEN